MNAVDLDGKRFSPTTNSDGGRVKNDAVFKFKQTGDSFSAHYSGEGVSDGHIIGHFTQIQKATLVYHSRAHNGALEVGSAKAKFDFNKAGKITIAMNWQWLNGSQKSGQSFYEEI